MAMNGDSPVENETALLIANSAINYLLSIRPSRTASFRIVKIRKRIEVINDSPYFET